MICFVLKELEGLLLGCIPRPGPRAMGSPHVTITSLEFLRSITLILVHFSLPLERWDSLWMRYLKCQGCPWETCYMRSTFPSLKNCICLRGMLLRCMRHIRKSCAISTFALRWLDGALEESSKCLGQTISFEVWRINRAQYLDWQPVLMLDRRELWVRDCRLSKLH